MGKKDATGNRSAPVEQYRKQIGKQDWKKSKQRVKSSKHRADEESFLWGVKEVAMVLAAIFSMIAGTYFFLYWQLNKQELKDHTTHG
ncbi:hypothetical protein ScPMuIL_000569 [Solemya velum]